MAEPGAHEIRTGDEFQWVCGAPVGVIVITGSARSGHAIAHRPDCPTVTHASFRTKVIENGGRNGRYFYFLRREDAEAALAARPCQTCG